MLLPSLRVITKRLLLLLVAYFLCRVLFLAWNWSNYEAEPLSDILRAFIYGVRFDLSAILLTNSLFILFWLVPIDWKKHLALARLDVSLFVFVNLICLGLNLMDTEFVKFIGKRSSLDLFMLRGDIQRHAVSILSTYWYFVVIAGGVAMMMARYTARFASSFQGRDHLLSATLGRVAVVGLCVLGIRGGFQFKPLHPMDAHFTTHQHLAFLTLNTPFTLIRSQARGQVEHATFFASDEEAVEQLRKMNDLSRPPLAVSKDWNVVVILLESFGSEYTGAANKYKGYTPFFDSLTKEPGAFYFKNGFANARRSIEGLPAVICGLPSIMSAPIITSDFSNNRFECLPKALAQRGYSTYFLHGAHNGSMHFDTFSKIAGFEHFVGLDEYPKDNPEDLDNYWGVLDEPMLQYAVKTIDQAPKPTMLGIFTLSSHHPYYIPPKYQGRFPKGTLEIHESIGYTDYSLQQFFESARKRPWFNKTIFVLSADHTQKSDHKEYDLLIGSYRVPILIYAPGLKDAKITANPDRIAQQIDMLPSVLDLLGLKDASHLWVGKSVFDNGKEGVAYNFTGYGYWYLNKNLLINWLRDKGEAKAYSHTDTWDWDKHEIPAQGPEVEAGLLNLKAVVQYLSQGLIKNNLYKW